MKPLILAVLLICISLTESSAKKRICKKDTKFLLAVVRVCNLYRRAILARKRNWSSLQRYAKYALRLSKRTKSKKQRRSYEDEDSILDNEDPDAVVNDVDSSSLEDFGRFDDDNDLGEIAADKDDSESDPQSDTDAGIRRLRSFLHLSLSRRHQRSPKRRKPPPPSKDRFGRLRTVCLYLTRLLLLR
ncbi:uncharacterized protein [Haliotis asinina]|uniref:uncharacterized protein n=1 Tax=Haliotis asinina TaxID=109174 RepID=UPI003531A316